MLLRYVRDSPSYITTALSLRDSTDLTDTDRYFCNNSLSLQSFSLVCTQVPVPASCCSKGSFNPTLILFHC